MPRNRNKAPCQVPGCRNWAMRGHTRCRAHRDAELGPRGGGAPPGNLNAVRTGRHAQPVPPGDLSNLAHQLVADPQHTPQHLEPLLASIHGRAGDPFKTLVALQAAFAELLPLLAQRLFAAELDHLLRRLPPHQASAVLTTVRRNTPSRDPGTCLAFLRRLAAHLTRHLPLADPRSAPLPDIDGQPSPAPIPSPPAPPSPNGPIPGATRAPADD